MRTSLEGSKRSPLDPDQLRILHISATFTAGVYEAVKQYVSNTPNFEHHLLVEEREFDPFPPVASRHVLRKGISRPLQDVRRVVQDVDPDVIHAHSSWAGVWSRVPKLGPPVVYQPHALASEGHGTRRSTQALYAGAEKVLARRAESFVGLSAREIGLLEQLARRRRVFPLHNTASVPSAYQSSWSPTTTPRFGMVGRLSAQKDPEFFAAVATATRVEHPDAEFVWIGDGDERTRRLLSAHGVRVTGWLSLNDVATELSQLTAYLHTAKYEGFPLSVLDAAFIGVPVAVRAASWTDGVDLEKFTTPEQGAVYAKSIVGDVDRRNRASVLSRDLAEKHSEQAQARELGLIYRQTASQHTSGREPQDETS